MSNLLSFLNTYSGQINMLSGLGKQWEAYNIQKSSAQAQINSIRMSGDINYTGGMLSAEGYRQSKASVAHATSYNIQQDNINTKRQLQSLSNNFQRTIGSQITQTAAQGISLSSKSALMLRNEAVSTYDTAIRKLKIDAENNVRNQLYSSRIRTAELEQQARNTEYQAQLARVQAANRAAEVEYQMKISKKQATSRLISQVPTILGQLFQE